MFLPQATQSVTRARGVQDGAGSTLHLGNWRRASETWQQLLPRLDLAPTAISPPFDDGHGLSVFLGGPFTRLGEGTGERAAIHVARVRLCGADGCYANCDGTAVAPVLNIADFTCFLQRFAAGDSWANCDQSTAAPVLNVADFSCFLQRFAAGCP